MPRGKKYNAAEMHFLKEKQKLLKQLRIAEEQTIHCKELEQEIASLQGTIKTLEEEKSALLKKLDMTPEDLEREKRLSKHADAFLAIGSLGGYF